MRLSQVFCYGALWLFVASAMALVPIAYFPLIAHGEVSSPGALSWLLTAFLLTIVPGLYAYPNVPAVYTGTAAGLLTGVPLMLEYYKDSVGEYAAVLKMLGETVGWSAVIFFVFVGALAAISGVLVGWHINYALIAIAKHSQKDWP